MAELLLFQLYGPLASWGEPAVGEYRPSATHPGKSQIAGLLGAALGLTRDREEELAALAGGYGLAVRIDAEGELLRDYHTTQVPPARRGRTFTTRAEELAVDDLYTILSQRDYRVEAAWTCVLWATASAPYPLADLAEALRRPRFTLYLGRKSCPPALPLRPELIDSATLKDAFAGYPLDDRLGWLKRPERHRYFWEEPLPDGLASGFTAQEKLWVVPRRDRPGSRRRWQFATRDEHHAMA
ncbi:CRISPR system Cascade subunit CasD [Methylomarinovum caldicuralii]|uniref:CRISPR system Cascade subunit CasD n=1 Tax=Methylomarinovum caldicuralii TaxID=438856 RepID=A0AAU9CAD8_9GAMM|nr:type I-E CRISPR-associated protein Cas5/CasD [Methylomarinovum caldicuralii]BCX83024.1 CRISPR system Cascade subunit CasD [Methylomarinovum caldicuralii]